MAKPGKLDRFDHLLPANPDINPWQPDGSYRPDLALLTQLLGVAVGTDQRSGVVAGAADVWAAEELRRAGFDPDEVWPRRTNPRVLPRDVRNFVASGLTRKLRAEVEERYDKPGARRALPSEAYVMGSAYSKQSDVVVASWAAGVELLISTKTMLSSYAKNLRNRFEEGYGDAKNLRGRHPLSSLGFLFIAGSDIPESSLEFAIDMLRKRTTDADVYDCACLLILDGANVHDGGDDDDEAGDQAEPAALMIEDSDDEAADDEMEDSGVMDETPVVSVEVSLQQNRVPPDLAPALFFERLVVKATDQMPVTVYQGVRQRRRAAASASDWATPTGPARASSSSDP
jgi:hypothetical protein